MTTTIRFQSLSLSSTSFFRSVVCLKHPQRVPALHHHHYSKRTLFVSSVRNYSKQYRHHDHDERHNHYPIHSNNVIRQRHFCAVKELSWCSPRDSPNHPSRRRKDKPLENTAVSSNKDENENNNIPSLPIISQFGIIAAMCRKTRMIGKNGELPWYLPDDRIYFQNITKGRVLILGKNTLYEGNGTLYHISHVKYCIVISTTLTYDKLHHDFANNTSDDFLYIARSFTESLYIANVLVERMKMENRKNDITQIDNPTENHINQYDCWIGGGERVFEEAITHPSCQVIHLTMVNDQERNDCFDDAINLDRTQPNHVHVIARFPAKYRWDRFYNKYIPTTTVTATNATIEPNEVNQLQQSTPHQLSLSSGVSFERTIYVRK